MTAGLWFFLFHLLTGRPKPKVEPVTDPEVLLQQAQQQMREVQAKNRERAVQAITQKNNLLAEQEKTRKIVERLREKAETASAAGNHDLERQLRTEADKYQATVVQVEASLERATRTTEKIKEAVRREEERIRTITVQAMAAKVVWRQGQISASIEELASPAPSTSRSPQARLDAVLTRIESTRDALGREAEAAMSAENYTVAIRLLAEQQNLEQALVFGSKRS